MCQQITTTFSCAHTLPTALIPCTSSETSGTQCPNPTPTPLTDPLPCPPCTDTQSSADEVAVLAASLAEYNAPQKALGAVDEDNEDEVLRRVLAESMDGLSLGVFDEDELERAVRASRQSFKWAAFVSEQQWNRMATESRAAVKAQEAAEMGLVPVFETGGRATASGSGVRALVSSLQSARTEQEEESELEEQQEVGEEQSEQASEEEEGPPEPDTSKPHLERLTTFVGCQHVIKGDTAIPRDEGSPEFLRAIARGKCPKCVE